MFDVPYSDLQTDLDNDTLPAFAFVTPNSVHDMHDGPDPTAIQNGDTWLSTELPKILNSAAYQARRMVVFVTFDEGAGGGMARTVRPTLRRILPRRDHRREPLDATRCDVGSAVHPLTPC